MRTSAAIGTKAGRSAVPLVSIVLIALAACAGSTDAPGVSLSTGPASIPASSSPVGSAAVGSETTPASPATSAMPDHPPVARLRAEGGDPVAGQLGTYVWGSAGSDSPWLRGAPLAVGAGEPLSLELSPAVGLAGWRARYVPDTAPDAAGAIELGEGGGVVRFTAPPAGRWTVEVALRFDGAIGSASYFWRLDVR